MRHLRYRRSGFRGLPEADRAAVRAADRLAELVLTVLMAVLFAAHPIAGRAEPARSAGGTIDLAQAIELVAREVAAVETSRVPVGAPGRTLQVEDAQLDFSLVEVAGRGGPRDGPRLAVPAADFGTVREAGRGRDAERDEGREAGRDRTGRQALRRRVTLDLAVSRLSDAKLPAGPPAIPPANPEASRGGDGTAPAPAMGADLQADTAPPAGGLLSRAIADIAGAARVASAAEPAFEAKRLSIDLDFAIERDSRGAPILVAYAADRPIESRNVHRLRLRLVAADRSRSARREPGRTGERSPDAAVTRSSAGP